MRMTLLIPFLLVSQAQAFSQRELDIGLVQLNSCFGGLDEKGNPKPASPQFCKVISNIPGEGNNPSTLTVETNVNVGSMIAPKMKTRRMEITITKANGKATKFERKYIDPETNKVDSESMDLDAKGLSTKIRMNQEGVDYRTLDAETCKPLMEYVKAFNVQQISACGMIGANAREALKTVRDNMAKENMRLGSPAPNPDRPSLSELKVVDIDRAGDVFGALLRCKMFEPNTFQPARAGSTSFGVTAPNQPSATRK